jgi:prolyl oligopeptidase
MDQIDDYHGTKVADPYRWLEDTDSDETKAWVAAQNKLTYSYLDGIPARARIKERWLTRLWNFEKYDTPFKEGNRYFYGKNDGLQNQSVIYTATSLDAPAEVLIDPNTLSSDGTVALSGMAVSYDGKLMAYGLSVSGSDWQEWRLRDVETKKDLPDLIKWVKFSAASWTPDGKGFFYSRYDEPGEKTKMAAANYFQKLYFHRIGTLQSEDILIYERPDQKEWGFGGNVTEDGRYLIINVWRGTDPKNRIYYKDLQAEDPKVITLLDEFDASYTFVGNDGPLLWFQTDLNAPRGRLIAIDTTKPERKNWKELVPQAAETLSGVNVVHDMFIASYLKDARTQVKVFKLDGAFAREVDLPGIGSAWEFGGKRKDSETFYGFTGFTTPTTIYRYEVATGKARSFAARRSTSIPATTRRNRSSTKARTALACRCS